MNERQQITLVVVIGVAIAVAGLLALTFSPQIFPPALSVKTYDAEFYGNGTLVEQITYDVGVSGQYRMLFRNWEAPLTFDGLSQ
ncbi:MAG TPA: DUF2207 domain-containing protein, partial [Methanomicrobiales archaeon]|nr:DUF2207 domain-containing protein [Methanomicrobiales archaeon]